MGNWLHRFTTQHKVLELLEEGPMTGRELNARINGILRHPLAFAFYRVMAMMVRDGQVEYFSEHVLVNGHRVTQHWYSLPETDSGEADATP